MAETENKDTKNKTTQAKQKQKEKEFQLEQAFEDLETIITKLESDDVSLKESIELYGKGAKLVARCKEELTGIEKEMIVISENFNMEEETEG